MKQFDNGGATRRAVLALATIGGAALAGGEALARPAAAPSTPDEWLRAYMLMRGALDDRLVIGFAKGRYYGVVNDESRPLYGFVAATFARHRRQADGSYAAVSKEVAYFCDLETGKVIDTFRNPYTNQDVAVVQSGYPAASLVIGRDMALTSSKPLPGMAMRDGIVGREVRGDDVFVTEETVTAFQAPGMPRPVRYSEVVTLHASLADLNKPGVMRVRCQNGFTSIVSWRPWLKMGDRPGHLNGIGYGAYGVSLDELPPEWREAVAVRQPEVLRNPASLLPAF